MQKYSKLKMLYFNNYIAMIKLVFYFESQRKHALGCWFKTAALTKGMWWNKSDRDLICVSTGFRRGEQRW